MDSNRQEILDFVDAHAGAIDVSMRWIRNQYAPDRPNLSKSLCNEIRDWLDSHNIRSLDGTFPTRETERIVLYRTTSPIGVAIQAARMEGDCSDLKITGPILHAIAAQLAPAKTA